MEQFLPIELVDKIYKMKHRMEMEDIMNDIRYIDISLIRDYDNGYGLVFGGSRDVNIGEKQGYGIFIKKLKPNSVASNNEDIKIGWQIVEMNGYDLEYATFYELTEAIRSRCSIIDMRLKYNHVLYKNYN